MLITALLPPRPPQRRHRIHLHHKCHGRPRVVEEEDAKMPEHIISVTNLVKTYKMGDLEVHALRGINIDVNKSDFVAIMGKSG